VVAPLAAAMGCGGARSKPPAPAQEYELGPLVRLTWLLGDYEGDSGRRYWVAAGDMLYGVAFDAASPSGFTAMVIGEEREHCHGEGIPGMQISNGREGDHRVRVKGAETAVTFETGIIDRPPFDVSYRVEDDTLTVATRGARFGGAIDRPTVSRFHRFDGEP